MTKRAARTVIDLKQTEPSTVERVVDDILVSVTVASLPSELLAEFLEKIVLPYYSGSLSRATKDLMQKAIEEEDFVSMHAKTSNLQKRRRPNSQMSLNIKDE
jgi:hypothetical protein